MGPPEGGQPEALASDFWVPEPQTLLLFQATLRGPLSQLPQETDLPGPQTKSVPRNPSPRDVLSAMPTAEITWIRSLESRLAPHRLRLQQVPARPWHTARLKKGARARLESQDACPPCPRHCSTEHPSGWSL